MSYITFPLFVLFCNMLFCSLTKYRTLVYKEYFTNMDLRNPGCYYYWKWIIWKSFFYDVLQYVLSVFPRKVAFEPLEQCKFRWYFVKKIYGDESFTKFHESFLWKITLIIFVKSGNNGSTTCYSKVVLVVTLNRSSFQKQLFLEWRLSTGKSLICYK